MPLAELRVRCLPWRWPICVALTMACSMGTGAALVGAVSLGGAVLFGSGALGFGALTVWLRRNELRGALGRESQRLSQVQQQVQVLQHALKNQAAELAEAQERAVAAYSQWQDSLKALQVQHRDLQDAHVELAMVAESDSLGALGSRRALEERLNRIVHAVGERRAQAPRYAFLIVDLDELQSINAKWGRHVGDFVLGVVSTRLALAQREGDLLVRWGGEEFLALIPAEDPAAARACAERLRLAVAAHPVALPWGEVVQLTVSVGYACWPFAPERSLSWQEAVRVAEWAMQQAKANGRNRSVGGVPGEPGLNPESVEGAMTPLRLAQWAAAGQVRALAARGGADSPGPHVNQPSVPRC